MPAAEYATEDLSNASIETLRIVVAREAAHRKELKDAVNDIARNRACELHSEMIKRLNVAIMGDKQAGVVGIVEWRDKHDLLMDAFKEILDTLVAKEVKRSVRDKLIIYGVPSVTLTLLGIMNNMASISAFMTGG